MSKVDKILAKVMDPRQESNISFSDLCFLLVRLGYAMRQKGSHHSFTKMDSTDFINIQPDGNKAKGYQIRQIREILRKRQA